MNTALTNCVTLLFIFCGVYENVEQCNFYHRSLQHVSGNLPAL